MELYSLVKNEEDTNTIKYFQKGKKKILINEIRANQVKSKNKEFIKLRKFLVKKWKNKYEEKDLILKNYDFCFLNALFDKANTDKTKIIFQYVSNYSERNELYKMPFSKLVSYFNNTIENIEKRNEKYKQYSEYKYNLSKPKIVCKSIEEINKLSKQYYSLVENVWEYDVKRNLDIPKNCWDARDLLIKKWQKKIHLSDLLQKYKEFALLNDIFKYAGVDNLKFSEYKELIDKSKISKDMSANEIIKLLESC